MRKKVTQWVSVSVGVPSRPISPVGSFWKGADGLHLVHSLSGAERRMLILRIKVPWEKLADFIRGVIMSLRRANSEPDMEVLIQASSNSGLLPP